MAPMLVLLLICQALHTTATSKTGCGRPALTDGIDESTLKDGYEVGEEVTLTCELGYTPSTENPRRIACSATGEWTKSDFTCSPKMCPLPSALQDFMIGMAEVPFNTVINYSCGEGYVLLGASEIRCLHDGTWSHPPSHCKALHCPLPKPPKDGRIVYDRYGQSWWYECDPPKAPTYERGYCRDYRNFTEPPVCREVSCPIPTGLPNGFITFAVMREHSYKEKVKYACNEHYVLDGKEEIECLHTGNWTSKPYCRAPCSVGIKRGRISYNSKMLWIGDLKPNRILHGESISVYCLNTTEKCGYPVVTTCKNGSLPIPECYEEPGILEYTLKRKSLPSEITKCGASPASPTNPARTA